MPKFRTVRWTALVAAVCPACLGQRSGPVARTDSAGIEIVRISAPFNELRWRADTLAVLGGQEAGPLSFYQVRAAFLDVDSEGRIVVLDPSRRRVVVLDDVGTVVAEMGREGDGPGELRAPLGVSVSDEGEISVHDASRVALIRYGLDGAILPQRAYPFSTIGTGFRHLDLVPGGIVVWARDRPAGGGERLDRLLMIAEPDTVELIGGRSSYRSTAPYPACGMTFTIGQPHAPGIYWAQWGNRVAVAIWGEERVDVFDGARRTRSLRLAPRGPAMESDDAVRALEASGARGPCNSTPREMVRKHGFYPYRQNVSGLAVGPDGSLWVRRRVAGGDARIALLDSTGAPVGLLPAGFPLPLNFLPDGRLLVSVRDSLDVERIALVRTRG